MTVRAEHGQESLQLQGSLFSTVPELAADAELPIVLMHRPRTGIGTAMLSPLPLRLLPAAQRLRDGRHVRLHWAAIDDAAGLCFRVGTLAFSGDIGTALDEISAAMRSPPQWPSARPAVGLATLADPAYWGLHVGHPGVPGTIASQWADLRCAELVSRADAPTTFSVEAEVRALCSKVEPTLRWLLDRAHPDLKKAWSREGADLMVTSVLLERAHAIACPQARARVAQALRIEPLPVLRLMVAEAPQLLDTVIAGCSLTTHVQQLVGVGPAVIRHLARSARVIPDMTPGDFLLVVGAIELVGHHLWPEERSEWTALAEMARLTCDTGLRGQDQRQVLAQALAAAAGVRRLRRHGDTEVPRATWHERSGLVHVAGPRSIAFAVIRLHAELARIGGASKVDASRFAERWGTAGPLNSTGFRLGLGLGERNGRQFAQAWISTLPDLGFVHGCYVGHVVRCVDEVTRVGKQLRNCLAEGVYNILRYALAQRVLVAIRLSGGSVVALASFNVREVEGAIRIELDELKGPHNSAPSNELIAAGLELERSMQGNAGRFESYLRVCAAVQNAVSGQRA